MMYNRSLALFTLFAAAALATAGAAQVIEELPAGAVVVLAGRIDSAPKGILDSKKMQVEVGPRGRDYTIHFGKAELTGYQGRALDEDGLDRGQWVRVEGVVKQDRRRIEATRVQVVAEDDLGFRRSRVTGPGYASGYFLGAANAARLFRQAIPPGAPLVRPVVLVGRVTDDTGPLELSRHLQLSAANNIWTLEVAGNATVLNVRDEAISVHEIADGQWVRAVGRQMDDLRVHVDRIESLGPENNYRSLVLFRNERPLGYVEFPAPAGNRD